ncbi:thioesterase PaaI family protein [Pleurotus pulmonarius]
MASGIKDFDSVSGKELDIGLEVSNIAGNASPELKAFVANPLWISNSDTSFAIKIAKNIVVSEVSILPKNEEPLKKEARVVCEITVTQDMLNGGGKIHGGCSATLVDICTSYALIAYNMAVIGEATPSVSQAINMVYHSPADLGDKLKIVNTTMSVGARAMSARCEIWNVSQHRLVASGTHITMQPSLPKSKL